MDHYEKAMAAIKDYIQQAETPREQFSLGVEIEHFILQKHNLAAVSFFASPGIESTLREMTDLGWIPVYEGQHLVQLYKSWGSVTLEPGGQVEISITPRTRVSEIEEFYRLFVADITTVLNKNGLVLAALGYQPSSTIDNIPMVPKQRYTYMYKYFADKGTLAHNMMKGTASIQVSMDFSDQQDFRKKIQVANYLTPLFYACFDNSPFFEGNAWPGSSIRSEIWNQCDCQRCGITSLDCYDEYARHVLATPPIILRGENGFVYTGKTTMADLLPKYPLDKTQLEHVLSMQFLDVRVRNYLELRMGDALPLPHSLGYVALWKGLLYDDRNLEELYAQAKNHDLQSLLRRQQQIVGGGLEAVVGGEKVLDNLNCLLEMAERALPADERHFLAPLQQLAAQGIVPKQQTLGNLHQGREAALQWCLVDNERG